jgi:hypothetical protein
MRAVTIDGRLVAAERPDADGLSWPEAGGFPELVLVI